MTLLNEVDKPGSDVEVYIRGLDRVLLKKMQIISDLREKLLTFYSHLKTEESMSRLYERNQELAQHSVNHTDQDGVTTQISQQDQAYPEQYHQQQAASLVSYMDEVLGDEVQDFSAAADDAFTDNLFDE